MRKKRNSLIVLLILSAAVFIPAVFLFLASVGVYEYPTLFTWKEQKMGPISVFFFLFMGLELLFNGVWCPFRRWTVANCRDAHCSLWKLCKNCDMRISLRWKYSPGQKRSEQQYLYGICEKCEIIVVGLVSIFALLGMFMWEMMLLGG